MEKNAPWQDRVRLAARQARGQAVATRGIRDGSANGSAFRSHLLPAAPSSSPGHCLDLG